MKEYTCTALIKYSKQEVEVHINALKIALQGDSLTNYRGPYLNLLKDMQRIKAY